MPGGVDGDGSNWEWGKAFIENPSSYINEDKNSLRAADCWRKACKPSQQSPV